MQEQKTSETISTKEPFDVWWPKYMSGVNQSVLEAEQHLTVPNGTISAITKDTDFIATVKTYAVVEPILNELIASRYPPGKVSLLETFSAAPAPEPKRDYASFVAALPISGNTGKLALAETLNLLSESEMKFVRALARIRNRYAHNIKNIDLCSRYSWRNSATMQT